MLKTTIHTHEIPIIFEKFKNIVGEDHWLKRAKLINEDIKGKKYLEDYLVNQNSIIFSLYKYSALLKKHGAVQVQQIEDSDLYPALSFAAQTLSIIDHSSNLQKKLLIRRIHGAFKNPDDMRALQFEMLASTHFVKRDNSIVWPDMEGSGAFDILVKDIGDNGLEVECKSVSINKGRKIHRRDALEFHHLIRSELKAITKGLQIGLSVVLTVPNRLPGTHKEKKVLARRIRNQILSAQSKSFDDGVHIRVSEFIYSTIVAGLDSTKNPIINTEIVDQITATENRETMIIESHAGGGIIFVLQSSKDDAVLKYLFNTLKKSANDQVSKNRPALFLVSFHGIEDKALIDIAHQEKDPGQPPTALQIKVSNFLDSKERDHIVGVCFFGSGSRTLHSDGHADSGSVYFFMNRKSHLWHEDFNGLFI